MNARVEAFVHVLVDENLGKMFVVYSCTVNFQLGVTSNFLAVSTLQYLPFSSGIYIFSAGIIFSYACSIKCSV